MKKTYTKILSVFLFGAVFLPVIAFAQGGAVDGAIKPPASGGGVIDAGIKDDPANKPIGDVTPLQNPIRVNTIPEFVEAILGIVLTVGVPIVAFFIILSGFMFVVARGNAEKLESAKRTFLYTLIGAALLLGAWVIAQLIQGTVDALRAP